MTIWTFLFLAASTDSLLPGNVIKQMGISVTVTGPSQINTHAKSLIRSKCQHKFKAFKDFNGLECDRYAPSIHLLKIIKV